MKEGIPTKKKNGIPKPTKESATEAITEELSTIAQEIRVGSNVGFKKLNFTSGFEHAPGGTSGATSGLTDF